MPGRCAIAGLTTVFLLAATAAAPAAVTKPKQPRASVTTFKQQGFLGVALSGRFVAGGVCGGSIRAKRSRAALPELTLDRRSVVFRWYVPRRAPSGRWRFTVRCRQGGPAVSARARSQRWRSATVTAQIRTGSRARSGPLVVASSLSVKNAVCNAEPNLSTNPYTDDGAYKLRCECTWYAAQKRPDLYEKYGKVTHPRRNQLVFHGDAKDWWEDALFVRTPTGPTPKAGALVVWDFGRTGHIAYVQQVNLDGRRVTLTDYNAGYDKAFAEHVDVDPQKHLGGFKGYIYDTRTTPPAPGPGPTPAPTPPPPSTGQPAAPSGAYLDTFYGVFRWTDNSTDEEGFRVYVNDVLVGTEPANATAFSGTAVVRCGDLFSVSAFNTRGGESARVPSRNRVCG